MLSEIQELLRSSIKPNLLPFRWENYKGDEVNLNDLNKPTRIWLWKSMEHMIKESTSVLELGCHSGINLMIGKILYPSLSLTGADISEPAIQFGQDHLIKNNILGVSLNLVTKGFLPYKSKSFDIVFSDALFLYIEPFNITFEIEEMVRISKKYIVFLEFNTKFSLFHGVRTNDGYLYNFKRELSSISRVKKITFLELPNFSDRTGRWKKFGTLILVELNNSKLK